MTLLWVAAWVLSVVELSKRAVLVNNPTLWFSRNLMYLIMCFWSVLASSRHLHTEVTQCTSLVLLRICPVHIRLFMFIIIILHVYFLFLFLFSCMLSYDSDKVSRLRGSSMFYSWILISLYNSEIVLSKEVFLCRVFQEYDFARTVNVATEKVFVAPVAVKRCFCSIIPMNFV